MLRRALRCCHSGIIRLPPMPMAKHKNAGIIVAISESVTSQTPPIPGNRLPLSLASQVRLTRDSAKSPIIPTSPARGPGSMPPTMAGQFRGCDGAADGPLPAAASAGKSHCKQTKATIVAVTIPPTAPSRVFPGLSRGTSLCFPSVFPLKYAPASAALVTAIVVNSAANPQLPLPIDTHRDQQGHRQSDIHRHENRAAGALDDPRVS